ncbi:hypothetical protein scyTo_0003324 [Scyliorhinus torazame]|uniref:Uncharacterized protein n=1 Tax=Scyliorhinus torazame TaxID=75743 RepID=A0A401PM79_SCYTO|nr:hypothetical protein [Scyliorhinus torazame]
MSSPSERPEEKLEAVIQKLEDTVLNPEVSGEDKTLTVRGEGEGGPLTPVPARIREIVTKNLTAERMEAPQDRSSMASLQEENCMLQEELSRMEDLLAQSHAERDELAIKFHAVSERMFSL